MGVGSSQQAMQQEECGEDTSQCATQLEERVEEPWMKSPVMEDASIMYPNIKLDHYDEWEAQDKQDLHEMLSLGVHARFKTPQELHGLKHANSTTWKQRRKDRRKAHRLTIAAARAQQLTPPPSSPPPQEMLAPAPKRRLSSQPAEPSRRTRVSSPRQREALRAAATKAKVSSPPPRTVTIEIVVPPHLKPGGPIGCRLPNGMLHTAVVPVGALPGSKVQFVLWVTSDGPVELVELAGNGDLAGVSGDLTGVKVKPEPRLDEQPPPMPADARVKLEEQPPSMPADARVKLEFV